VDRQTRKAIKSDKFAEEVTQTWDFISEHKKETTRYGLIALAAIVVGAGIYFFINHQAAAREESLATALKDDPALVPAKTPPILTPDQSSARSKLYEPIALKDHGTLEGSIAQMSLAEIEAEKGTPEGHAAAEKMYQDVMDSAPKDYASVARIALAQAYAGDGKMTEAKALIQDAIDHPTALVSKEEAQLQMAIILEKSNPAEAKKLLTPLVNSRTALSRSAVTELGQLPQ
jgi:hypothetical protein